MQGEDINPTRNVNLKEKTGEREYKERPSFNIHELRGFSEHCAALPLQRINR
jgi:hypothetical protein